MKPSPNRSKTLSSLRDAAHLLNRLDLRAATETESRAFNAAEAAVREGIALIENPDSLFEHVSLEWKEGTLLGHPVIFGHGLGLKYQIAQMMSAPGWAWAVGDQIGPTEFTREEAVAACETDFRQKLKHLLLPPSDSN